MEDGYPILGIVVVLLLLVLKAIISYGARAIEHINEVTVRKRAEDGDDKSKVLLGFIEKPDKYMNAVEVILTTSSVLVGYICAGDIAYTFRDIGFPEQFGLPVEITKEAWTVAFVFLVLFISILFGDVFPKKLALKDSNKAAYGIANVVLFFIRLVTPIAFLIEKTTNLILRLCHIKPEDLEENVTEDEIMSMVNEGQEQGVLASNEAEMISNIIEFDEKEVKDIMTHRKKIVAIDCNQTVEQTLRFMLEKSYSRFPLYEDDINNIIGILHVKDVTRCYMSSKFKNKPLKLIARKPYFVPDTQNIDVLFNDMQLKKIHMAIAVDEYGQTAGLVAMEDILEEIVGNILDEYDEDEKLIIKQGEGRYLMKGLASLDDIEDTLGIEIEDTLNGLLTSLLNRIPSEGEHISVSYAGYLFEILDVKYKMIRFVRVTKELEDEPIELGELKLE